VAFDSHLTNGRNHSQTVCGAERALSITLAGLRLQDSQCIHFHMDGLPWGDPSGSRFATIWLPGGVLAGSSIFRGHCSLFGPVWLAVWAWSRLSVQGIF
jgi:hypothetical protein